MDNNKSDSALREEKILQFWKERDIFQKSLKKEAPRGKYVFYDGPPFATGTPHYGHILGSTAKDVIGRYQTMRGFTVPRRWGWDCHGLPIENIVEKDLNISGKKAIEELGIDRFVEHARSKVLTYVSEWEKTIDRIGRWVDFKDSYKTMDNTFIESVWWALGELNKKELLYEGVRVLAYCPRCETPIANSEIAMDNSYKDITDISVYVKFKLIGEANTYLLAWTTTPWTLPGNTAIAVNNDIAYLYISNDSPTGKEILILAKDRYESLKDKFTNPEIIKEVQGSKLVGMSYEPVFSYYKNIDMPNKKNIWKVWHADFVTLDKGTGIAHEAPAFGEEDMGLAKEYNIPFIRHVEPNGTFTKDVIDFVGIKVKPKEDGQSTDVLIIKHLAKEGKLFAKEKIIHSYPHCYRCETPLLYYALPSWFVNIQKVKTNLLKDAESMNWVPSHLKDGRFKNTMEAAPDWTISRNRYWASPLPIWKSYSGKMMFVNSLDDLKSKTKRSGNRYFMVRHGESENNVLNRVSCNINAEFHLTDKGEGQIKESAKNFKDVNFDYIFSSPIMRTKETANLFKKELNSSVDIIFDDRLRELNFGDYEDRLVSECERRSEVSEVERLSVRFPNGESHNDIRKRIGHFLYELESKHKNKNILIVTHGDPVWLASAIANSLGKEETIALKKNYPKNGEIKELDFIPLPHNENYELDLHRPYIDATILVNENGEEYKRILEVIDCWFESGSMPFAQDHFPFENKDWQKNNFPSGFVAEYIAQTRTWFYYTHVISSILFNQAPFKNVVTTGTILAEDGQKMSKSKNNFPDPWILFNKYGVDALRFYLMSCPVMKGEDINFSEKAVQDISNKIINRLNNVLAFYELYPKLEKSWYEEDINILKHENILDKWISVRLNELMAEVTNGMESYDMAQATKPIELFIEDLSTWYLRRSRDGIKDGDEKTRQTLYFVLKTLAKIMAPFVPFLAEDIWQKLKSDTDEESVHLALWPKFDEIDGEVIKNMAEARRIVSLGLEARQKVGIRVRQPLSELKIKEYGLSKDYTKIIEDELNIKMIVIDKNIEDGVVLNTELTEELKVEGNYRELVRAIQDIRKKNGLTPSDIISLGIETDREAGELVKKFEAEIKKTVLAKDIKFEPNEGEEITIGELVFKISIQK